MRNGSSLCLNYVAVFSCAVFLTWVPLLAEKLFLALENNQTAFDSLSSFAESLHCNGPTLRSHIDRLFFRTRFFFFTWPLCTKCEHYKNLCEL